MKIWAIDIIFKAYVQNTSSTAIQQLDLFSICHLWGAMLGSNEL